MLGKKIKLALKERGKTQVELGEAIGMARQNVNKLLTNNDIKLSTLIKVCKFLEVDTSYFINDSSNINLLHEPAPKYNKPQKYIEQRMDELEKRVDKLENNK